MLKSDMDEMEQQVNDVKSRRAACYAEIDEIQQSLTKASVVENTARMNLEQTQLRQLEAKQRLDAYAGEQADLDAQLREIEDNEDSIQMELETSQNLEREWNEKIESLQKLLEDEREREAVQMKQSEEVHLSLASLEQQNSFIQENIIRIEEETAKFEQELSDLTEIKAPFPMRLKKRKKRSGN